MLQSPGSKTFQTEIWYGFAVDRDRHIHRLSVLVERIQSDNQRIMTGNQFASIRFRKKDTFVKNRFAFLPECGEIAAVSPRHDTGIRRMVDFAVIEVDQVKL